MSNTKSTYTLVELHAEKTELKYSMISSSHTALNSISFQQNTIFIQNYVIIHHFQTTNKKH